jgi:(2Fe-2S) ferredoxin
VPKLKRHVFVCINVRPPDNPKGCCAAKGGEELRDKLAGALAKRGLNKMIRANKAGCLDVCEYGAAMVVYPEQVWYGGVKPEDIEEIVEKHLIGGEPVERLLIQSKMTEPK